MNRYRLLFSIILLLFFSPCLRAGEWQWSVTLDGFVSNETNRNPTAFLWIPADCMQIKAIIVGQHNMSEETLFDNPLFREKMQKLGIGFVWITPGIDQQWDVSKGTQQIFEKMMVSLADVSGYSELKNVPIVPIGHSAMATYPWNFAAWNPERTLAIISLHGDAPRTNLTGYGRENLEWGRTRNIDGIPGLMIEGEYEWWEARVNPALAFRMMYPESCISFLCDAGRGHFDVADETAAYIALFLEKAINQRLTDEVTKDGKVKLNPVNPTKGWLAERWHPDQKKRAKAAPYSQYKGDPHDAFWYFDREIAEATETRYTQSRGKKEQYLGFEQNGSLLTYDKKQHVRVQPRFNPEADGITFHLKAVCTDSLRTKLSDEHADATPIISRICGPVEKVNDTTFMVSFYRMGMNNPRRTGDICLLASQTGDRKYKSAVQEVSIRIPYRNTEGQRQYILFPGLPDVKAESGSLSLKATSDCGLPVSYYIKEGPAEIKGDQIVFTPIPPRSKFPVKVTVVAWQYGIAGKVQTAEPVERSFYILKSGETADFKSGRIDVGNGSLYYEEAGSGEPVIFVHGHSLDHRMWDEQFAEFAKEYRVIRYDLRGYGASSSQTEDYQFTHVQDLVTLMDSLHIRKAHIVGLSLGGFIGADMLGWFPERMASAFLASGNIRKSKGPSQPMTKEEALKRDEEIAALKVKGVDVMKREWFEGLMSSGGTRKERMRQPLWEMIDDWDAWQPLHKEVRVVAGLDAYEAIKKNHPTVPTLIVEGKSANNRYSNQPEILKYLPNGKLKVLEDCGHMLNMEQPEAFNAALREFLKQ
ncbi:alpha/beta fold hydrolase [Bacteroides cellulosilyticus]|jgi:pimeloyl-ACP methyl ester carboxylesterase|uniref:alpha/beta fold hydrolase n=1 Tax=Bacteroides cellulosilyticus TaxID=246787 RepID=UPI001D006994|nr:alpha/beta hydrolase [Bacteroides cellulosilyticus]